MPEVQIWQFMNFNWGRKLNCNFKSLVLPSQPNNTFHLFINTIWSIPRNYIIMFEMPSTEIYIYIYIYIYFQLHFLC